MASRKWSRIKICAVTFSYRVPMWLKKVFGTWNPKNWDWKNLTLEVKNSLFMPSFSPKVEMWRHLFSLTIWAFVFWCFLKRQGWFFSCASPHTSHITLILPWLQCNLLDCQHRFTWWDLWLLDTLALMGMGNYTAKHEGKEGKAIIVVVKPRT